MNAVRFIFDPAASGACNMAVDEVLLETAATTGQATLRFYTWQEPTLSLGYFQAAASRQQHLASCDCPLVRRASGGGAIVHDRELTYSLAWPRQPSKLFSTGQLYQLVHNSLIELLQQQGIEAQLHSAQAAGRHDKLEESASEPFLCFHRRSDGDVLLKGHKILGSAQRRHRQAVLQHGSLLLAQTPAAPELPGIYELTGQELSGEELSHRWLTILITGLRATPSPGALTDTEWQRVHEVTRARFGSADFTQRR